MSDKALIKTPLTEGELELTQKIQTHFPRGRISPERIGELSCQTEELTFRLEQAFQEPKFEVAPEYLPIWKTFRVGGLDKAQLQAKLKVVNREVNERGKKFFNHEDFTTSPEPKDVFFARVNLAFLGFKKNSTTKDWLHAEFFAEWSRKHLQDGWVMELCEQEDGPSIGYQYTAQPNGEILWVIAKPLVVEGRAFLWAVLRCGGGTLWLNTDYVNPENEWRLLGELLLRLRKIQPLVA